MGACDRLEKLRSEMERIRQSLYRALDKSGGTHSDATVQEFSRRFDHVYNDYLKLQRAQGGTPRSKTGTCRGRGSPAP